MPEATKDPCTGGGAEDDGRAKTVAGLETGAGGPELALDNVNIGYGDSRTQTVSMVIPNAEQINSSPELVFGQDTINMVDEFMKNEAVMRSEVKKKGILRRILTRVFCC